MKILLADDSGIIRQRVRRMLLERVGNADIYESASIEDTMRQIRHHSPDVIVLDLRLPDGSGLEVLQPAKAQLPESTIIVFTNYPFPQYQKKCVSLGADYFFDKSTDAEMLTEQIGALFAEEGGSAKPHK